MAPSSSVLVIFIANLMLFAGASLLMTLFCAATTSFMTFGGCMLADAASSSSANLLMTAGEHNHPCHFNTLCTCSKPGPDLGRVECFRVHLPSIPRQINQTIIYSLIMRHNKLQMVHERSFYATGVFHLEMSFNDLSSLPSKAFYSLEATLRDLNLRSNRLYAVPKSAIASLRKLRSLNLNGNRIIELKPDDFNDHHAESLRQLRVAANSLTFINTAVFMKLRALQYIDLSRNNIHFIADGGIGSNLITAGVPTIRSINFAGNRLDKLPVEILSNLTSVRAVNFASNLITSTYDSYFKGKLVDLDTLNLADNLITELPSESLKNLAKIGHLRLDYNPIQRIAPNAFQGVHLELISMIGCGLNNVTAATWNLAENSLLGIDLSQNDMQPSPATGSFLGSNFSLQRQTGIRVLAINHNSNEFVFNGRLLAHVANMLQELQLEGHSLAQPSSLPPIGMFGGGGPPPMPPGPMPGGPPFMPPGMMPPQTPPFQPPPFPPPPPQFTSLRSYQFSKTLSNGRLTKMDLFGLGVSLEKLHISNANLYEIAGDAFNALAGLKMLNLSYNSLNRFEGSTLRPMARTLRILDLNAAYSVRWLNCEILGGMTALEYLNLADNNFNRFSASDTCFADLVSLQILVLNFNSLSTLPGPLINSLLSLQQFHASFNKLKTIDSENFYGLPSLQLIDLQYNLIRRLKMNAFSNLKSLQVINLEGNDLEFIERDAFINLPRLHTLQLQGNKLSQMNLIGCFDQVGTLSTLTLQLTHNQLMHLEHPPPSNPSTTSSNDLDDFNNPDQSKRQDLSASTAARLSWNGGDSSHLMRSMAFTHSIESKFKTTMHARQRRQVKRPQLRRRRESPDQQANRWSTAKWMSNSRQSDTIVSTVPLFRSRRAPNDGLGGAVGSAGVIDEDNMSGNGVDSSFASDDTDFLGPVFISIKSLDLRNNNISRINGSYFNAVKNSLTQLKLAYNSLSNISAGVVSGLRHLQLLDLSHNRLNFMNPHALKEDINLQIIDLSSNLLTDLPPDLFNDCVNLRSLNLSYNDIRNLNDDLLKRTQLTEIVDLSHNKLTVIPTLTLRWIASTLKVLDVSYNSIRFIRPQDFNGNFSYGSSPLGTTLTGAGGSPVVNIGVSPLPIASISLTTPGRHHYSQLVTLNLRGNQLKELGECMFGSLSRLLELDLSLNPLITLNDHVFTGLEHSLESLNLAETNLTQLPVLNLPGLRHLNISHNNLSYLFSISLANTSNLRTLDMSHNKIQFSPNNAWHILSQLQMLDLSSNPIITLSNDSFIGLDRLEELNVKDLYNLHYAQYGTLRPMPSLRRLHVTTAPNIKQYSVGKLLLDSHGLEELTVEVRDRVFDRYSLVEDKLFMPKRISHVTIVGSPELESIEETSLTAIQSQFVYLTIQDIANVSHLSASFFANLGRTRHLSLDLRHNNHIRSMGDIYYVSPQYSRRRRLFIDRLYLAGSEWQCDCKLAWIKDWIKQLQGRRLWTDLQSRWPHLVKSELQSLSAGYTPASKDTTFIENPLITSNSRLNHYQIENEMDEFERDLREIRCENYEGRQFLSVLRQELSECRRNGAMSISLIGFASRSKFKSSISTLLFKLLLRLPFFNRYYYYYHHQPHNHHDHDQTQLGTTTHLEQQQSMSHDQNIADIVVDHHNDHFNVVVDHDESSSYLECCYCILQASAQYLCHLIFIVVYYQKFQQF